MRSYLTTEGRFRYRLPCLESDGDRLLYFPYWRYKGMLFSATAGGVRTRIVDASRRAAPSPWFPFSVGVRSQVLKLRFVTADDPGRFVQPALTCDDVVAGMVKQFSSGLPQPILHQAQVGEAVSLIYAPYRITEGLRDAITGKPLPAQAAAEFAAGSLVTETAKTGIGFLPALCPNCGWDLEGESDALVLLCRNCDSAWYPAGRRLKAVKFRRSGADGADALYLPFWRLSADVDGLALGSYADLIAAANLPRVVKEKDHRLPFRFWVPAFKVRPRVLMLLSGSLTLAPPRSLDERLPGRRHHPVNLPVTEAQECLKIVLANTIKPRRPLAEVLPRVRVRPRGFTLVWVAFREDHHEYVLADHRLAVNKNLLSLSRNL